MAMRLVVSLLLAFTLVVGNSSALAGAVCRHDSQAGHLAARQSGDARIAGAALGEEAASSAASNKGALANVGAFAWVADLSPSPRLVLPFDSGSTLDPDQAVVMPLVGRSPAPLLEPPAA